MPDEPAASPVQIGWEEVEWEGGPPPLRSGHSATRIGRNVLVFGGTENNRPTDRVIELTWAAASTQLSWRVLSFDGSSPSARVGHAACAVGAGLWVFAGTNGRNLLRDVWVLRADDDGASWQWQSVACKGETPARRMGHSMVHLERARALLTFGGFVKGVAGGYSAGIMLLDLASATWSEPKLNVVGGGPAPAGRLGAAACALDGGSRILVLGGSANGRSLAEALLIRYPPSSSPGTWTIASLPPPSEPRAHGCALVTTRGVVLHVGGGQAGAPPVEALDAASIGSDGGARAAWAQLGAADGLFDGQTVKFALARLDDPSGRVLLFGGGAAEGTDGKATEGAKQPPPALMLRLRGGGEGGGGGGGSGGMKRQLTRGASRMAAALSCEGVEAARALVKRASEAPPPPKRAPSERFVGLKPPQPPSRPEASTQQSPPPPPPSKPRASAQPTPPPPPPGKPVASTQPAPPPPPPRRTPSRGGGLTPALQVSAEVMVAEEVRRRKMMPAARRDAVVQQLMPNPDESVIGSMMPDMVGGPDALFGSVGAPTGSAAAPPSASERAESRTTRPQPEPASERIEEHGRGAAAGAAYERTAAHQPAPSAPLANGSHGAPTTERADRAAGTEHRAVSAAHAQVARAHAPPAGSEERWVQASLVDCEMAELRQRADEATWRADNAEAHAASLQAALLAKSDEADELARALDEALHANGYRAGAAAAREEMEASEARAAEGEKLVRRLTATLRKYVERYGADDAGEAPRSQPPARLEQRPSIRFT